VRRKTGEIGGGPHERYSYGMRIQHLSLQAGHDEIPWAIFEPEDAGKEYVVLWLQGWRASIEGHQEGVERMAQQTGTTFVMLDYSGHGKHKLPLEKSTKHQQLDEVIAVYDELVRRGYKQIIAFGGSFGSYMAALLSAQRSVHALVLRAPANYDDEKFDLPYDQILLEGERPADSSATEAVRNFGGYVYVLEHELDEVVPRKIPQRYFEVTKKGNYLLIPKTKHSPKVMKDPKLHYDYIELLLATLVKSIKLQDRLGDQ